MVNAAVTAVVVVAVLRLDNKNNFPDLLLALALPTEHIGILLLLTEPQT
jgi:hypothetical protein